MEYRAFVSPLNPAAPAKADRQKSASPYLLMFSETFRRETPLNHLIGGWDKIDPAGFSLQKPSPYIEKVAKFNFQSLTE